jgi:hypothetical protein
MPCALPRDPILYQPGRGLERQIVGGRYGGGGAGLGVAAGVAVGVGVGFSSFANSAVSLIKVDWF